MHASEDRTRARTVRDRPPALKAWSVVVGICVLAVVGPFAFPDATRAGATVSSKGPATLEQACLLEGRSDGALLRGKRSPNYGTVIDQAFSATTDPTAKIAAAAEAQFVELVTTSPSTLKITELVADDPISGYCKAEFPAAYFQGSHLVSTACADALATIAKSDIASTSLEHLAEQRATLTACSSRAEWLQAIKAHTSKRINSLVGKGTKATDVLQIWCADDHDAASCKE